MLPRVPASICMRAHAPFNAKSESFEWLWAQFKLCGWWAMTRDDVSDRLWKTQVLDGAHLRLEIWSRYSSACAVYIKNTLEVACFILWEGLLLELHVLLDDVILSWPVHAIYIASWAEWMLNTPMYTIILCYSFTPYIPPFSLIHSLPLPFSPSPSTLSKDSDFAWCWHLYTPNVIQ